MFEKAIFSDKPAAYLCRSYLMPPMLQTSDLEDLTKIDIKVRQLHLNTENAYARGLTGGAFSICHPKMFE